MRRYDWQVWHVPATGCMGVGGGGVTSDLRISWRYYRMESTMSTLARVSIIVVGDLVCPRSQSRKCWTLFSRFSVVDLVYSG